MGLRRFLDDRLGLSELLRKTATEKRPPRGTSWLHTLGYAALALLLVQAVTGIALAFHYVPSVDHAYDSLRALERDVPWGGLVRAVHHWGASAMVVLVVLHLLRVFFTGAYKRPRELTWLFGLGLLGIVLGFGFTGYLLPWDQKAYFATKVGVGIAAKAPLAGEAIRTALYGGAEIGPPTLSRFFALHVLVLPAMLLPLLVMHLMQVQRHGVAPLGVRVDDPGQPGRPYHPYHTLKEAIVALAAVGVVFLLALRCGAPLEAEADPTDPAYEPRPDWYFLGAYQALKLFKGDYELIGSLYLPTALVCALLLLPFIDRNPERRLRRRPLVIVTGCLVLGSIVVTTVLGLLDAPKHYRTPPHPFGAGPELRAGYDLFRREGCLSCHTWTVRAKDDVYGRSEHDAPDFTDVDKEPEEMAIFLKDPQSQFMPAYDRLSDAERLAIANYVRTLMKVR